MPTQEQAHHAVGRAVDAGTLVRGPCRDCGAARTQAHHPDYARPLDVVWLCRRCHRAEHRRNGTPPSDPAEHVRYNLRLDDDLRAWLVVVARRENRSLSRQIVWMLGEARGPAEDRTDTGRP